MKTIAVCWSNETGEGRLIANCEDDQTLSSNTVRWKDPITGASDSWEVARAVTEINGAEIESVDHDNGFVFVHVKD